MVEILSDFMTRQFVPHGHCYLWRPGLVSLHAASDALIALAYYSIPMTLIYFVRQKKDLPFDWMFLLFAAFIIACGTTHVLEVWTLWYPTYWLSGWLKAITAVVSLYTALQLIPLVPRLLAMPSPAQLEETNRKLAQEISIRIVAEAALSESQQMLQLVMNNIPQAIFWKDKNSVYLGCNYSFAIDAGLLEPLDIVGKTDYDLPWKQEQANTFRQQDVQVIETNTPQYHQLALQQQADGKQAWLDSNTIPLYDTAGKVVGVLGTYEDVTERKLAEEALTALRNRHELILNSAGEGIYGLNIQGNITFINPAAAKMIGWEIEELLGQPQHEIIHHSKADGTPYPRCECPIYAAFKDGVVRHADDEAFWRKDSTSFPVEYTINPIRAQGQLIGAVVIFRDITERLRAKEALLNAKNELEIRVMERTAELAQANWILLKEISERHRVEEQLMHDAFHDALTGLPNRAFFVEQLELTIARSRSVGEAQSQQNNDYLFAVLFLDLDRFKVINDSLGHMVGDQLLLGLAQRLQVCLRAQDVFARLGGDEFTILLGDIKAPSDATLVAERIQIALKLPFNLDGIEVFTTASIGIVLSTTGYDRAEELLRAADMAMYRAKELGKARYEFFSTEMSAGALSRLQLETAMRRAIERQEFRVYYQPIISLVSGKIIGFEALVRWQQPQGLIAPVDFIPMAEENGMIVPIGYWVLRAACHQMKNWLEFFSANTLNKITVNLSVKQFSQPDLLPQIRQILQETNLDASYLILEITESAIVANGDEAIAALSQLRDLGVELVIDDFGTGYSSLGRLHSFPINGLKIDRSFISHIGDLSGNLEIAETIVALAHKLDVHVTAEGVETKEQLALLRSLNCKYAQGYFFASPLDSVAATALIVENLQW